MCVLSIIVAPDECEVKHIPTSSMSLTVSWWASLSLHTQVQEHIKAVITVTASQPVLTNTSRSKTQIHFNTADDQAGNNIIEIWFSI